LTPGDKEGQSVSQENQNTKRIHEEQAAIELSVVIPCFRSAAVMPDLLFQLDQILKELACKCEVILVDDCSPDNLRQVAMQELEKYPNLHYVELMFNVGQFRALMCGLAKSKGQFVVTMDDDLQHPPSEIKKLYSFLHDHPELDAVFGQYEQKKHSWIRNLGSLLKTKIHIHTFRQPPGLFMSAFRCLRRPLVDALLTNRTHYPVLGPLILSTTRRIKNVTVIHHERRHGRSGYNFFRLISATLDNILSFSSLPLKVISGFGICISFFSFLLGLIYFGIYFVQDSGVLGWTSLFLAINFYGGILLLALGIIGEYLVRIFGESKGQPLYIIRSDSSSKQPN
jgi:glycosyltransferase involved in cell wall biosynthesis